MAGLVLSFALAVVVLGRWSDDLRRSGVAPPCRRGPGLRGSPIFVLGVAFLGLVDAMLGPGGEGDTHRGWRGHAAAVLGGRFSSGAIKAIGAFGLAAYAVSGRGRESLDYLA